MASILESYLHYIMVDMLIDETKFSLARLLPDEAWWENTKPGTHQQTHKSASRPRPYKNPKLIEK